MHTVLVASNNTHKLQELNEIVALACAQDAIALVTPRELGLSIEPDENSGTYLGNAQIKARAFAQALRPPFSGEGEGVGYVLADDSGLEVDALDGRPGVETAPYAKAAPNGDGPAALLAEMQDAPAAQRRARFRCVIVLISPDGAEHDFEGVCEGRIGLEKRGQGGFGFDPVFDVGDGRHLAELTATEKHAISHRGLAMRKVIEFLVRNK
jgi:XTP/dITP diphosphohydrolase